MKVRTIIESKNKRVLAIISTLIMIATYLFLSHGWGWNAGFCFLVSSLVLTGVYHRLFFKYPARGLYKAAIGAAAVHYLAAIIFWIVAAMNYETFVTPNWLFLPTFQVISVWHDPDPHVGVAKDWWQVYCTGWAEELDITLSYTDGIFPLSYTGICNDRGACLYFKDHTAVYVQKCSTEKLPFANPLTFRMVDGKSDYASDNNNVYYSRYRLETVHAQQFRTLGYIHGTDGSGVFARHTKIPGADAASMRVISQTDPTFDHTATLSYDKNHVYYLGQMLNGLDGGSFVPLSYRFYKDNAAVYFIPFGHRYNYKTQLESGSMEIFRTPLNPHAAIKLYNFDQYVSDGTFVYWVTTSPPWIHKIPGADSTTFREHMSESYPRRYDAEDNYHIYLKGQVVQVK